ncbi:hypothetical protein [Segetibacter koreensis]|uniref:hypothetical protein n=1 Tax=Segetibacter koreensis TaxID=398037 RepID=UPI000375D173|nr:hypothetical protein [Segetibacter koreensis]
MKKLCALSLLAFAFACNEPMQVTGKPDAHAATGGTLGSSNAENQLPNETRDTTTRVDSSSAKIKRDTL